MGRQLTRVGVWNGREEERTGVCVTALGSVVAGGFGFHDFFQVVSSRWGKAEDED